MFCRKYRHEEHSSSHSFKLQISNQSKVSNDLTYNIRKTADKARTNRQILFLYVNRRLGHRHLTTDSW